VLKAAAFRLDARTKTILPLSSIARQVCPMQTQFTQAGTIQRKDPTVTVVSEQIVWYNQNGNM